MQFLNTIVISSFVNRFFQKQPIKTKQEIFIEELYEKIQESKSVKFCSSIDFYDNEKTEDCLETEDYIINEDEKETDFLFYK